MNKGRIFQQMLMGAYSGRSRPRFRSDADRDSGVMPTGIPLGSRPQFRSMATGLLM